MDFRALEITRGITAQEVARRIRRTEGVGRGRGRAGMRVRVREPGRWREPVVVAKSTGKYLRRNLVMPSSQWKSEENPL
jgi:hypothetical protein